jgi:hypothetical protein
LLLPLTVAGSTELFLSKTVAGSTELFLQTV